MDYKAEFTITLPDELLDALGIDEDTIFEAFYEDGKIKVEGAWEGIDECGASDKGIFKLKKGDKILITGGFPNTGAKTTNFMKIEEIK